MFHSEKFTLDTNVEDENLFDSGYSGSDNSSEATTIIHDLDDLETLNLSDDVLDSALDDDIDVIILNNNNEEENCISLPKTSTIEDIVTRSVGSEMSSDYDVKLNGRILPRNITFRDASILNGTKVQFVEREYQIFVRTIDGRSTPINIRSSTTIIQIKQQLLYAVQLPVDQMRLLFEGNWTLNFLYLLTNEKCLTLKKIIKVANWKIIERPNFTTFDQDHHWKCFLACVVAKCNFFKTLYDHF